MCIHNIAYQGVFCGESADSHNLPPYLLDYLDPSVEELPPLLDPAAWDADQVKKMATAPPNSAHAAASVGPVYDSAWQEVEVTLKQRAAGDSVVDAAEAVASSVSTHRRGAQGRAVPGADSVHIASNNGHSSGSLEGQTIDAEELQENGGQVKDALLLSRTEAMLWRRCWRKGRTSDNCNPKVRTVSLSALALVSWHALLGEPAHSNAIMMRRGLLTEEAAHVNSTHHTRHSIDHDDSDSDNYSEGEEQVTEGLLWHSVRFGAGSKRGRFGQRQGVAASHDMSAGGGCLLYTSPSPRDRQKSRMPSSA